jgi:hypothetical protein
MKSLSALDSKLFESADYVTSEYCIGTSSSVGYIIMVMSVDTMQHIISVINFDWLHVSSGACGSVVD